MLRAVLSYASAASETTYNLSLRVQFSEVRMPAARMLLLGSPARRALRLLQVG